MPVVRTVHVTARRLVQLAVLAGLVASLLVAPGVSAEAVTRPRTLYQERPVSTGVVEPGFPIDHVGVVFDLPPGADVDHDHGDDEQHDGTEGLAVRFRADGRWGPWQHVIEDGAQAVGTWTGALVDAGDAEAYQVRGVPSFARDVRAAALNTTDGPAEVVGHRPAGSAEAFTSCRSRADWGADESIRTSDRSYAPVQMMTVHHTATQNDDPDPDARVRAIYEYHVETNRWDDIGYQALISEDGTVYEGRWSGSDSPSCLDSGGTGWEFGHADTTADADMVTGAHTGGYNTGNFGVALLGTLTDVAPETAARSALVEYLAELSERHGIDPQGQVDYDNGTNAKTVDAISGHRDLTATECPGGTLYADLPDVRADVATSMGTDDGSTPEDGSSPPPYLDDVSSGERTVAGAVSGSYVDTHADGGATETISEVDSGGGRPADRHSLLEHVWTVPVTGGSTVTLFVDAAASAVGDGEDFAFAYSLDGGATYVEALTIPAGAGGTYSASLPATTQGTVHIRVRDTDRTKGARALDSIVVDHLFVRSETSETTTTLSAPGSITATATSATTVDVVWDPVSSAWGYELQRGADADADGIVDDWTTIASLGADQVSYPDAGLAGGTTYGYRVRATQGTATSAWTASGLVTTPAVSGITLSATGYKVKGQHHVDLSWSGATNVRIYRDGAPVADAAGSDHTDVPGGSGRGQYTYRVCAIDSAGIVGACSGEVTVTFS